MLRASRQSFAIAAAALLVLGLGGSRMEVARAHTARAHALQAVSASGVWAALSSGHRDPPTEHLVVAPAGEPSSDDSPTEVGAFVGASSTDDRVAPWAYRYVARLTPSRAEVRAVGFSRLRAGRGPPAPRA